MSTITVHLRGMSGSLDLEVPEGATLADVRDQAGVDSDSAFAVGGQRVDSAAEAQTPVTSEATITSLPPEVKAGF